jgi:transcriptional regulator with XRE-family HTH domain
MVNMAEASAQTLGKTLRELRDLSQKSLKAVAEPANISAAYLMKLERDEVQSPSPHVLHRLAEALGADYLELMRRAGYLVPAAGETGGTLAHALSADGLSDEEAAALSAYLTVLRRQTHRA